MSVQTILTAGFLFLGGVLLHCLSWLEMHYSFLSEWFFPFGLLFILIGAIPLMIHLAKCWFAWYCKLPIFPTDNSKKED